MKPLRSRRRPKLKNLRLSRLLPMTRRTRSKNPRTITRILIRMGQRKMKRRTHQRSRMISKKKLLRMRLSLRTMRFSRWSKNALMQ